MTITKDTPCPWGCSAPKLDVKKLTPYQKEWLGMQSFCGKSSPTKLSKRFDLSVSVLKKYRDRVRQGLSFESTGGMPPVLDAIAIDELKNSVQGKKYKVIVKDFAEKIAEKAAETASRRGNSISAVKPVSRTKLYTLKKELGLSVKFAEETTKARAEACSCFRNMFCFMVANWLMASNTIPPLILNLDATQFKVGCANNGRVKVIVSDGDADSHNIKAMPQEKNHGITAYFIKYYLLISAAGKVATPVYVVADESMNANEFDAYDAPSLGASTDATSTGKVVFVPTRGCNKAFYEWLNINIVIPFVVAIKTTLGPDFADEGAWFQLDGEPIQIKVYEDNAVLSALNEHNITVGKLPASTTEVTQACDQKPFKACKTNLKKINDSDVEHKIVEMRTLKIILEQHEKKYKTFTATHKKYFVYGILRVQMALMLSLRGPLVANSFADVGIYPFDIYKISRNWKVTLPDEMLAEWVTKLKPAAKRLCQQGELFDSDLDYFGIMNNMNTLKDNLVVHRRRVVLLNNAEYVRRKEEAKVAAQLAAEKLDAAKAAKKAAAAAKKAMKLAQSMARQEQDSTATTL